MLAPAWSLDPGRALDDYAHDTWLPEDGLPQVTVHDLAQTRDGFLWIGTQEGLARFDGHHFEVFSRRNVPELRTNSVVRVLVAGDAVWLGTAGGGVLRYQGGAFRSWTRDDGLSSDLVNDLLLAADGSLWIATDRGVDRLVDGVVLPVEEPLPSPTATALLQDRSGQIWIGTRAGLLRGTTASLVPVPELDGLSVLDLHESRDGGVWAGTGERGIASIHSDEVRFHPIDEAPGAGVRRVLEDADGNLWAGTDEAGLARLTPSGELAVLDEAHGLSDDRVVSLLEDRDGSLWVGTYSGGLNRLRDAPFQVLGAADGLADDQVWSIVEGTPGHLWIGGSGVDRVVDGAVVPWEGSRALDGFQVNTVVVDGEGDLWAGTSLGGLFHWRGDAWTRWTTAEGLPSNDVFALAVGPDGSVWAGTRAGLVRMDEVGPEVWGTARGLPDAQVRVVVFDRSGTLWVGTRTGGVAWLDGGRFHLVPGMDELDPSQRLVMAIHRDALGVLWLGTQGGLVRWDGEHLGAVTWREGLPDDNVFSILEDDQGRLWMSSNRGVFVAQGADLAAVAQGHVRKVRPRLFGRADGLVSPECAGGAHPVAARTADGRLWFATVAGAASVDPRDLPEPVAPARAVLESVSIDGAWVAQGEEPVLSPGSHRVRVAYTVPALARADELVFQQHLEGFDTDWQTVGGQRVATWHNLDAGDYVFQVRACHPHGGCGRESEAFVFSVRPRPWETPLFLLGLGLGLVGLGAGASALRARALRQRATRLQEAVDQRTSELATLATELRELSLNDPLTGLRNRRFLMEALQPVLAERCAQIRHSNNRRRPTMDGVLVLCMLDIDHFKRVNDTYGHESGDAVLRQMAEILLRVSRAGDMCVRWGGEEFVVVLPTVPALDVGAFARRLRREVEAHVFLLPVEKTIRLTCSIGVVALPFDSRDLDLDVDKLVGLADAGLYRAKHEGRNAAMRVMPGEVEILDLEELSEATADPDWALYTKRLEMERLG